MKIYLKLLFFLFASALCISACTSSKTVSKDIDSTANTAIDSLDSTAAASVDSVDSIKK